MALPSKKQLHKHRRGARKALDTLDALNEDEQQSDSMDETKASAKKKRTTAKSKAERPKKQTKKSAGKKKSTKQTKVDSVAENSEPTKNVSDSIEDTALPEALKEAEKLPEDREEAVRPEVPVKAKKEVAPDARDVVPPEPVLNNADSQKNEKPLADMKDKKMDISLDDSRESNSNSSASGTTSSSTAEAADSKAAGDEGELQQQFTDIEEDTQKDRYLSFCLENEDYGIEIRYVTEIIVMQKITEVPNTSSYIKGVINLRGKVIPVMDVRERFHLETRDYDDRTCIVVVDVSEVAVGLIVDTVNEVIDIPENMVDPPPSTYSGIESSYISGMGKVGRKVKILLDVQNVLNLTAE